MLRTGEKKLPDTAGSGLYVMIIRETTALSDAVRYVYMKVTLELRQ